MPMVILVCFELAKTVIPLERQIYNNIIETNLYNQIDGYNFDVYKFPRPFSFISDKIKASTT